MPTEEGSRRTCTPCAFLHGNSGANRRHRTMPSISTCGTITLSQPDPAPADEPRAALPRLPRDKGRPVFAAPWEAQAFALAVKLSEQGQFTWKEWPSTLADE